MTSLIGPWSRYLRSLPALAKFALGMGIIVGVPRLSRRVRLPAAVGLLLSGVMIGPRVLGLISEHAPVADFFEEIGKLLLMFGARLEINLALFRKDSDGPFCLV